MIGAPMTKKNQADEKAPWDKSNPKPSAKKKHLSPSQKASAKASAKKAGRPYPNLVDNMRVAKK